MRKTVLITVTLLAALSAVQIAAIEFGLGFAALSEAQSRIILSLSYAFLASWIFYMLVVVVPDAWSYRHRSMVIARRLYHVTQCIEDIFQTILKDAKMERLDSKEDLTRALDIIDAHVDSDYQEFMIKHTKSLIEQCFIFSGHMDPKSLRVLDRIDFLMLHISFGTRVEGMTLGQSLSDDMWKLKSLNVEIQKNYRHTIQLVDREIRNRK